MLDPYLRPIKDRWLHKLITKPLRNLHPNTISLIALLLGLLAAGLLAIGYEYLAFIFWCSNRIFDGIDGAVARLYQQQSDFGGYLDILCDFVIYAALPIALVLANPSYTNFLCLALLLASFYVNAASWIFLGALLEKRSLKSSQTTSLIIPSGIIEGTETILFFSLFILFSQHLALLFGLMAALVALTVVQRLSWAYNKLSDT